MLVKNQSPPPQQGRASAFFTVNRFFWAVLAAVSLLLSGCDLWNSVVNGLGFGPDEGTSGGGGARDSSIPVAFTSLTPDSAVTLTQLTLVFDADIDGLTLDDISISGDIDIEAGEFLQTDPGTYTLAVTAAEQSGTVEVRVSKSGYSITPAAQTVQIYRGLPVAEKATSTSLKEKFGITEDGPAGVAAVFKELSAYIQGGGLENPSANVVHLGDWIALEGGLEVGAYADAGAISPADWTAAQSNLIVAGINSFTKNGNNTQHVVFHFQNIPVTRRMNEEGVNVGGYPAAEMRKYLVPVPDDEASGAFLKGLLAAGVPETALWGPVRYVSAGKETVEKIEDVLWLPTIWEMYNEKQNIDDNGESSDNQSWLQYYDAANRRAKSFAAATMQQWTGSLRSSAETSFCVVNASGNASNYGAQSTIGCVPAFCIK
jgi:hypothetical protein